LVDAENGANTLPLNYTNTTAYGETVYVRVENTSDSNCYDTTSFELLVNDSAELQTVEDWQVCDDDNDGFQTFDLAQKNNEILGTQLAADFTISYYTTQADAIAEVNTISGAFSNTSNPQTIYYRLESNASAICYVTDSFALEIFDTPIANVPSQVIVCDINETGIQTFDFSTKDSEVLNGQNPNDFEVSYFANENDAIANQNSISKTAYSNTTLVETIYARIQNVDLNSCYDITNFEIRINALPQLNLEDVYVICPDSPELTIDGGDFESWSWRDENGNELENDRNFSVTTLGDYSLTITQTIDGTVCEKTVFFEVLSSGAPIDFVYEIAGFSDTIIVEINTDGNGEFEYSSDGENFRSSNRLEVFPGRHTIYVRDVYECRTISKEIIALGYQKFFTPNNDGFHDFWNIIAVENFPESSTYIYDRYGKLLAQLSPLGQGWDGTYLGTELPSSDYWFRFENNDGMVFTGHFSLKR